MIQHQILVYCEGEDEPREMTFMNGEALPRVRIGLMGLPRALVIQMFSREVPDDGVPGEWVGPTLTYEPGKD